MSTKTTSVILIVGARNKASAALNAVGKSVDKLESDVGKFADVAESANVSVAGLIEQFGLGDLAGYGQQIADIRSKMVKFNAENVKGAKGLTAMKAGIAVAVAAISFELGKAIGDVVFQTKRWNQELAEAERLGEKLNARVLSNFLSRFSDDPIGNAFANSGEKVDGVKESIAAIDVEMGHLLETQGMLSKSFNSVAENSSALNNPKFSTIWNNITGDTESRLKGINSEIRLAKKQFEGLAEKRKALADGAKAIRQNSLGILASLGAEINFLKASEDDRLEIQLKQRGVFGEMLPIAVELSKEVDKLKREEKERLALERKGIAEKARLQREADSARAKAAADRLREEKRISGVYQTNINSLKEQLIGITKSKEAATAFRLEMQGVKSKDAQFLGGLKGQIEKLKKLKNQSSVETGNNTATNDRLGTGTVAAKFGKTAAVIEAERQTKLQIDANATLKRIEKFIENKKPLAVDVIG